MRREQQAVVLFLAFSLGILFLLTAPASDWKLFLAPGAGGKISSRPAEGEVLVDMDGSVNQRGTLSLPAGSTLMDALDQAGGMKGDLSLSPEALAGRIDKSSRLQIAPDGEGKAKASLEPLAPPKLKVLSIPISINSATLEELDTLPGIGPKTAQAIIEYREAKGKFGSPEGLLEVPGIGPKKLAALRPHIRID